MCIKDKAKLTQIIYLGLFFVLIQFYHINMGHAGLSLPLNIFTWGAMLLLSLWLISAAFIRGRIYTSPSLIFIFIAALLFSFPLLWTHPEYRISSLPRLTGIWGAVVLFFALQQMKLDSRTKEALLFFILLTALLECGLSLLQWHWPDVARDIMEYNAARMGGKPYGIFQQPNVLASFLATGYGVALYFSYVMRTRTLLWFITLCVQGLIVFILCLTQSRVGLCSAILELLLLSMLSPDLLSSLRKDATRLATTPSLKLLIKGLVILLIVGEIMTVNVVKPAIAIPVSSLLVVLAMGWCMVSGRKTQTVLFRQCAVFIVAALAVLFYVHPDISTLIDRMSAGTASAQSVINATTDLVHVTSSIERLSILKVTLHLIQQNLWLGHGLGSFETAFPEAKQQAHILITSYITHPHNELFYVWAEGGVIAVLGLLLALYACVCPALHRKSSEQEAGGAIFSWAMVILMLPIILHTLLEYPLYQSAPHLLVLLLLVRMGQQENSRQEAEPKILSTSPGSVRMLRLLLLPLLVLIFVALILLVKGWQFQEKLTLLERGGLRDFPEHVTLAAQITQYGRYDFDAHAHLLLDYNLSHKLTDLNEYLTWSKKYLQVYEDAGVYDAAIRIARYEAKDSLVQELTACGKLSFPLDTRFAGENSGLICNKLLFK